MKVLLGLGASGHSYSDTAINEFAPESDNTTSESIPDLTIQLGDELVIAIEAKDGGFDHTQLQNHARWLNAERFQTITWSDIADRINSIQESRSESDREPNSIGGTSLPSNSIELLLNEYKNILHDQLIPQSRVIASSEYTNGKNYVKARRDVGSNKFTGRVADEPKQSLPVPVAIYFRASGDDTNGQRLFFSREEWISLLKSISNPEYHRGLAQGDISSIVADYDQSTDADISIAHIEDSDGNEKTLFYGTGKGNRTNDLLFMNRSTAAGSNLQQPPMYGPDEFDKLFAGNDQMKQLFTNPKAVFNELEEDL
ncbi:hypothetical protein C496_14151 [Natronorubrum tibetense GA33]|uniref:Uncharacterized protein n=2 Tax=Natronorubrum tibetense TaxID=63128 RepID=L9VRZ2_9EURY|nr:hypothetical protein C496_14151 [Natronorubrum tibetense GA33]